MTEAAAARYLVAQRSAVDRALGRLVPPGRATLRRAMRYSLLAGGKRVRPILVLATGRLHEASPRRLMPVACAIELVHTYSLVHDDLPAMDDDAMRRGRPTCHRVYGEGMAILVGDAMLTAAFGLLAGARGLPAPVRARTVAELADAAGEAGMVGGQALDLEATGRHPPPARVREIHRRKTGALLTAAVRLGAIGAGVRGQRLERLTRFGAAFGLAFQITDDILDARGDAASDPGTDREKGKATYPAVLGLERARAEAMRVGRVAMAALAPDGPAAAPLRLLLRRVVERIDGAG